MDGAETGSDLQVGSVIANTYQITGLLGRGGMGAVWSADHARLPGKKVAIKVLHADLDASGELLARFRREAEIASRLGHPNIVEVHDFNELKSGAPYLVLEYLEGESLDARMERGPMTVAEILAIAREIGSALRAAHEQDIIHRDLKPQNVFLMSLGGENAGQATTKVLDFGISKIRGSTTVKTQEATMLGTPQYMAPEQASGKHSQVNASTDVFSFGVMLYEMFAGQPAFQGESIPEVVYKVVFEPAPPLSSLRPDLDTNLVNTIEKAMEKDQASRFQSVDAFISALTGSPLSSYRMRAPSIQSASQAEDLGMAATLAPHSEQNALANAQTEFPQPIQTPAPAESIATEASSKKPLWIWLVAAAVGAGAVGLAITLTRSTEPEQPELQQVVFTEPDGAEPEPTKPDKIELEKVEPPVEPTVTPSAVEASGRKPEKDKPTPSISKEARELVAAGKNALSSGNTREAKRIANQLKRGRASAYGWLLEGKAACKEKNISRANSANRRLKSQSKAKARELAKFCKRVEFPLP